MRIAVIGTGYVGLVSGACFSEFGVDVVCVDKDSAKIESLRNGRMPIFEPGLDKLVENNVKDGRPRLLEPIVTRGGEGGGCRLHRGGYTLASR